ncbi:uncharacterized protein RJT20DRAFT_134241 [Scheffersomyces xylosifermentans]|uniref:uncharacterized protein n=1 Tax=Scheffersomyces xylosifermentans TaxID=1304137 RepID=UPI00315D2217
MVVFIIYHNSNLAAYLIAISIYLYYQGKYKSVKIFVVENFATNRTTNQDFKPWCGVNTFDSLHYEYAEFLIQHLLYQVFLRNKEFGMVPLDKISIDRLPQQNYMNMDKPIRPQREQINISVAQNGHQSVALIYHPILVMNCLRQFMASTGKVVFTSIYGKSNLDNLLNSILWTNEDHTERIVLFDYTCDCPENSPNNYDFLVNSNSIAIRSINQRNDQQIPSSILWMPKFKTLTNIPLQNRLQYSLMDSSDKRIVTVGINCERYDQIESDVVSKLDIFYGLKFSDVTLHIIDELINFGKINILSERL